ncbi:MAG: serine/threonine-protein kinase [Polyangiaceae bacterium]
MTLGPVIGRGSIAVVHRGIVEGGYRVRRPIAVKVFDVPTSEDCDLVVTSLARAARHAACVDHPNVVATYEFNVHQEAHPFIVTELVEGRSLEALIGAFAAVNRRIPLDLALFIATEIAEGLSGARDARPTDGAFLNMVHSDLSTREVLLSHFGEVKVSDFGIGSAVRPGSGVRTIRALARRAATMAPEIAKGQKGDPRSDVFSLGIIVREMLLGPRFPANTPDADALELARDGFVQMKILEPQLPEPLGSILKRAIEIDPADRYPHASAMAYDLHRASLSMGVADGRFFLRSAMHDMLAPRQDEEATEEIDMFAFDGDTTGPDSPAAFEGLRKRRRRA